MPGSPALGVAGAHEDPVRPGVKVRRVAQSREVPPDAQQRLLRRVLGEVGVAQDPVRHRVEAISHGDGEAREGLLVAALCAPHEIDVHVPPWRHRILPALERYGHGGLRDDSIFTDA